MRELGADAAEIVPDAAQDLLDLGGRFLRKCRDEIGAADAVLAAATARPSASAPPPKFAMTCRVEQPDRAERMHGEEAEHRIAEAPQQRSAPSSAPSHAKPCGLELDHDLAEHLAAFQPRDAALEIGEPDLGVDHGQ